MTDYPAWICAILLACIDWLSECTGEGLDGEDAALVEQIRADIALPAAPLTGEGE